MTISFSAAILDAAEAEVIPLSGVNQGPRCAQCSNTGRRVYRFPLAPDGLVVIDGHCGCRQGRAMAERDAARRYGQAVPS